MILRSTRPASLRWVGHQPSDEMTAMLGVNRATGWEEFRTALTGFAIPGQTMIYADTAGSVGQVVAAHLPPRPPAPPDMLTPPEPWGPITSTVPDRSRHDPAEGFVASANDSPGGLPVGYFFAPSHRVDRLRQLLGGAQAIDAAAMRALQTDVQIATLPRLHPILLPALRPRTRMQAATVEILHGWTGTYEADSQGALAWELLLGHLVAALRKHTGFARYSAIWTARLMLTEDIQRLPPGVLAPAVGIALRLATAGLRRYRTWSGAHHVRLAHPLARLPFGGRHAVQFPAPGGNDTLDKSGHGLVTGRHTSSFGACARHVSDLADPDANEFVLLGGQDGWLGSSTFADQVVLWREGRRMTLPLRPETARARFPDVTVLRPG
jgi:penicillin G amidase